MAVSVSEVYGVRAVPQINRVIARRLGKAQVLRRRPRCRNDRRPT